MMEIGHFSTYLHFGDEIPRGFSSRMVQCEVLTTQLRACTEGTQRVACDKGGVSVEISRKVMGGAESFGQPSIRPQEKRLGRKDRIKATVGNTNRRKGEKETHRMIRMWYLAVP